jgi:GntR family transcriptional regulator
MGGAEVATTPRYREIADELRDAIMSEQEMLGTRLCGGARLPTEPELGTHYECSRGTIRQALQSLTAEGLIETRGRNGTFVRRLRMLEHSAHTEHPDRKGTADSWHSEVLANGGTPSQDFSFRIIPAVTAVANRLKIKVDDLVVVREVLRYVDGISWSDQVSYYPYDVASAAGLDTPHDIEEGTVRRLAARGFREIGWDDEVSCRPATVEEARTFGISQDASMIIYNRVGWTDQRPVRLTKELLPADRNVIRYQNGDLRAKYAATADEVQ